MRFPYDGSYRPPFPVGRVIFHNGEEDLRTIALDALFDTGSDGSLVPIVHLQQILAPAFSDTRIRSHWGEWRHVQLFLVDIELDGLILTDVSVVGDEQGDEVVLGRNILNRLHLTLDGPEKFTKILTRTE